MSVFGKNMPITYLINPAISIFKSKLERKIDDAIEKSMDFKPNVLSALEKICTPFQMSDTYENQERIFVNKKVGELLLAKVLITNGKYSESETILSQIIQSPLYTWESDLNKVFLKTGKHILWQLKPANASNATKEFLLYCLALIAYKVI